MADFTCEMCDRFYVDPRMLPCLHSFCFECLEKELETRDSLKTLCCPSCKEKVTLSENGVSDLPQDIYKGNESEMARISEKVESADEYCEACGRTDSTGNAVAYCHECKEYLCKFCKSRHVERPTTAKHMLFNVGQRTMKTNEPSQCMPKMFCLLHDNYPLDLYCKQCEKLICKYCMDFEHHSHREKCNVLEKFREDEMESLQANQGNANKAVASLTKAISDCNDTLGNVQKNRNEVEACIDVSLKKVKEHLFAQSDTICSAKVKSLQAQVLQLQRLQEGLSLASRLIAEAPTQTSAQLLSTKNVISKRVTKLLEEFNNSQLLPSRSAFVSTHIQSYISRMITFGCISGGCSPSASTCDAQYVPLAVIGTLRIIRVVAKDKEGKSCGYSGENVKAILVDLSLLGPATSGDTLDHGDGTYSVSITPQYKGDHELNVAIADLHIKGSPFKFYVTTPRETPYKSLKLSRPHSFTTNDSPFDVALTEEGYLVVSECKNQTLTLYTEGGMKIHSFGNARNHGKENGQLHTPSAVAIAADNVYVCELGNNRVQKFSISEKLFVSNFGKAGDGDGEFNNPTGICVDPQGRVFVADRDNNRIQVFRDNDKFAYAFQCQMKPCGLTFDLQGRLHVAAWGSNCIQVFTPKGVLLTNYGSETLSGPTGIAVNGEGYIAVSESGDSNRFLIFHPDLTLFHIVPGEFGKGGGITCNKDGFFWVVDSGNNCLAKY